LIASGTGSIAFPPLKRFLWSIIAYHEVQKEEFPEGRFGLNPKGYIKGISTGTDALYPRGP